MPRSREIEITIQTDRRVEIHATGMGRTWCQQCDTEVAVVTPQTASLLAKLLRVDLTHGAALSDLHMPATSDGTPHICVESLLQLASGESREPRARVIKGTLPGK
ncbi:MAG TPA: hypothetical protein VFF64_27140 [Candidatus Eremiobacteraceae bacterium]|nr:hypothetical protein [Candidatus Eremiobacteraceae bacterium]